ncbi:hypothetical protein [Bacillus sp. 1P06AnD]|uniref:hypothetical protein n=1 Tax=Bacillus sp. 1P06AnD TaxID=3132208 RepID=UPI0039A13C0F
MANGDRYYFIEMPATQHYTHEVSIGTTEVSVTLPFEVKKFVFLTNDDDTNDLLIAFNTATTSDGMSGTNKVIRLKPGETLQEFRYKATVIKFKRSAGSGNVRFLTV